MNENKEKMKQTPTFEDLKPMLRPTGIMNGIMKADPEKCSSCGLCLKNCCYKCWEMDENKHPRMKEESICFSCFNCMIACPKDAISIVRTFDVKDGFFDTQIPSIKMPLEAKGADGKPAEWNQIERAILERRSVRNFKKDPVPDALIRRVLEAGRFAPSGGNHQPWKFTVVTDKDFIHELETACQSVWEGIYQTFINDKTVMNMVGVFPTGAFDPRVQYGIKCIATKELPVFFNGPAIIFLGGNDKMNDPNLHLGICGQNMTIAAVSLGLGSCWSNFAKAVNYIHEIKAKLGFDDQWRVVSSIVLGYPSFKQEGFVPRHYRPVTWFRPGSKEPQIEV